MFTSTASISGNNAPETIYFAVPTENTLDPDDILDDDTEEETSKDNGGTFKFTKSILPDKKVSICSGPIIGNNNNNGDGQFIFFSTLKGVRRIKSLTFSDNPPYVIRESTPLSINVFERKFPF